MGEYEIALIGLIVVLLGIVWGFFSLLDKIAKVNVKVSLPKEGGHSPDGYSHYEINQDGSYDQRESIMRIHRRWRGEIELINVGEKSALNLDLYFHNDSPVVKIHDMISKDEILPGHSSRTFKIEYDVFTKVKPSNRTHWIQQHPTKDIFKDFKLVVSYKVFLFIRRYTIYTYATKENVFTFFKPLRFDSLGNNTLPKNHSKTRF